MELTPERLPAAEARQGIGAPPGPEETGGAEAAAEAASEETRREPSPNGAAQPEPEPQPDGLEGEELVGLIEWARAIPAELYGVGPRPIPPTLKAVLRPIADRAALYPPLAGGNMSPRAAAYALGALALVLVAQGFKEARADAQKSNAQGEAEGQRRGFPPPFRRRE